MWFLRSGLTFMDLITRILAVFMIVFAILPFHELMHGWVAYKLGDNTAKSLGRLTFNPMEHFDLLGALGILIFGFGWAKPIPVDARNFKNPKRDMAIVAAAGPLANLFAALVGGVVLNGVICFCAINPPVIWICKILSYYIYLNVGIAVFNLIPLGPLDGFKIVSAFLPEKFLDFYYNNQQVVNLSLILILFLGVFNTTIVFLESFLYDFIIQITHYIFVPII